jgi:hypothetical protein
MTVASLRSAAGSIGNAHVLLGAEPRLSWRELFAGTVLAGRGEEFGRRSVLIATGSQFTAAAALLRLLSLPALIRVVCECTREEARYE